VDGGLKGGDGIFTLSRLARYIDRVHSLNRSVVLHSNANTSQEAEYLHVIFVIIFLLLTLNSLDIILLGIFSYQLGEMHLGPITELFLRIGGPVTMLIWGKLWEIDTLCPTESLEEILQKVLCCHPDQMLLAKYFWMLPISLLVC
jgi:hypothetical protein